MLDNIFIILTNKFGHVNSNKAGVWSFDRIFEHWDYTACSQIREALYIHDLYQTIVILL